MKDDSQILLASLGSLSLVNIHKVRHIKADSNGKGTTARLSVGSCKDPMRSAV